MSELGPSLRNCKNKKIHPSHTFLDVIGPGIRGVKDYRCPGVQVKEDSDLRTS